MDKDRRQAIIQALTQKGAKHPCSRCGGLQFEVVAETHIPIQEEPGSVVIGGPSIPAAVVACPKCGHLWQHALGPLGLMKGT